MATMFHYSGEWIASFFGWDKAHSNVVYQVDGLRDLIINGYKENYTLGPEQIQTIKKKFKEHDVVHPFSLDGVQVSFKKSPLGDNTLSAVQNPQVVRWATYYTQSVMNSQDPDYNKIAKIIVSLCNLHKFSEIKNRMAIQNLVYAATKNETLKDILWNTQSPKDFANIAITMERSASYNKDFLHAMQWLQKALNGYTNVNTKDDIYTAINLVKNSLTHFSLVRNLLGDCNDQNNSECEILQNARNANEILREIHNTLIQKDASLIWRHHTKPYQERLGNDTLPSAWFKNGQNRVTRDGGYGLIQRSV